MSHKPVRNVTQAGPKCHTRAKMSHSHVIINFNSLMRPDSSLTSQTPIQQQTVFPPQTVSAIKIQVNKNKFTLVANLVSNGIIPSRE